MKKTIPVTDLERWKKNYTDPANKSLPVETSSVAISLEVLQGFIDEAKKNSTEVSGVRIYFIRYDYEYDNLRENYGYVNEISNSGLSQVSLAFVPVNNFDPISLQGKDFGDGKNIFTLAICHPADWQAGKLMETGTGLCPPKCNS